MVEYGHSLIINLSPGGGSGNPSPGEQGRIDSVEINHSLLMMREWSLLPTECIGACSLALGLYWEILPQGQYFSMHSLGQISGTHPLAKKIYNVPAMMQIGRMYTNKTKQTKQKSDENRFDVRKYNRYTPRDKLDGKKNASYVGEQLAITNSRYFWPRLGETMPDARVISFHTTKSILSC